LATAADFSGVSGIPGDVSERDLHEAARKVNNYISDAEKTRDGDNMVTPTGDDLDPAIISNAFKLLN